MSRTTGVVAVAAAALALPLVLPGPYHRHVLVLAGLFTLMALGFDLVLGYLGELSLGHAAFFGIGAYTTALLTRNFGVPFPLDLLLAGLFTGIFGLLIGAPSLRLRGPYFAIVTFGFAEILHLVALNWTSLTRGPMGLPDIPHPQLGPFRITTELGYYYLVLALIGVAMLVTRRLLESTVGHAFLAIRENEELASAAGIPTFRFKLLAFVIGMIFAGAAGSVYARYVHFVDPTALSFYYTVTVVSMVIVGGQGSIAGTTLGALVFTLVPEYLRVAERARLVIFGALLMLAIIFMPDGLRGIWRRARPPRQDRLLA
ncbi:MAG: branched-chain amino acid ABC transporter permease [Candidatus Rokuibacteriota bacterium]|nr:MAG: branched-chain amino acid ABC transporter permease [Candidatus Rokubacteria bacterium]